MSVQSEETFETHIAEGTAVSRPGLMPGDFIDEKYRIIEELGHGGMGTVYKAEQVHLERNVAIKLLRSKLDGEEEAEEFARRFKAEAATLARIRHPNAVAVYDFGVASGHPYIVMEYLPGTSLRRMLLDGKRITYPEVLRLGEDICRAIHHAHVQNVVHRDLKPDNIILTRSEEGETRAVVVDFGIAKIRNAEQSIGTPLTKHGVVIGTPQYTSPEQLRCGEVDGRSDIYALGIIFYELVAGSLPFISDSAITLAMKHLTEPPPPFDDTKPRIYVPDEFKALVLRCLAKEPNDRPANAAVLADELEMLRSQILHELPGADSAARSSERATGRTRRMTRIAAGLAIPLVALIAIPNLSIGSMIDVWLKPTPPVAPLILPSPEGPTAKPVVPVVSLSDEEVDLLVANGRQALKNEQYLEAITHLKGAVAARPGLPELARLLADAYVTMGDFPEAQATLSSSLQSAPRETQTLIQLGYVESQLEDHQAALRAYQRAVELGVVDHVVYNNLGVEFQQIGKHSEAISAFQKALRADSKYLRAYYNLADSYEKIGRWDKAIMAYRLAAKIDSKNPTAYQRLSTALTQAGRPQEAHEAMMAAMRLYSGFKEFEKLAKGGSVEEEDFDLGE